ncbi:MAG: hypothetical protein JW995_07280 [Melioribacteraceae bacterium]|nr:hypothetical protein [Melioribacteraceae bacterium]
MNLEFRTGYSYGGDYSGLDFEVLLRYKIINESFSICGIINLNNNAGSERGGTLIYKYTRSGYSLNPGIGLDYLLTEWLGAELFYIHNIQNYYGYTHYYDYGSYKYYYYKKYLYHTFKFGIRYIF